MFSFLKKDVKNSSSEISENEMVENEVKNSFNPQEMISALSNILEMLKNQYPTEGNKPEAEEEVVNSEEVIEDKSEEVVNQENIENPSEQTPNSPSILSKTEIQQMIEEAVTKAIQSLQPEDIQNACNTQESKNSEMPKEVVNSSPKISKPVNVNVNINNNPIRKALDISPQSNSIRETGQKNTIANYVRFSY